MIRVEPDADLVGRARLVKEVTSALDDVAGFGAMLVGEPGVGKTALAAYVLEHLRWTAPVLHVNGGPSLRSIPFGALAPYLHTLSVADADSPVAVLRAVMAHLTAGQVGRPRHPPLLVVDDAHELDDSSSALLAQLITARRAKLLVMIRNAPDAPAEIADLGADGLLTRFEVTPLDRDAVSLLCTRILGGPVLTGTSHALAIITGGNPMFLRALLEQGTQDGYLVERNGVWRLANEQTPTHLRLGDLIRSQLRSRSPEDLESLELVALAEPIPLQALTQCIGSEAVERLQSHQLIVPGQGPDHPVSLRYPLHGEVLRAQVPAARSIVIRQEVLAVLETEPRSLEDFLRTVSWGLDCGMPLEDRILLEAAGVANRLHDHAFAARAVRAVSAPDLRSRTLVELARVQAGRGNYGYAEELAEEAMRRVTDLRAAKEATLLAFDLKLATGGPFEDLSDIVDRLRSVIADLELRTSDQVLAEDAERYRLGCRLLDCRVAILQGRLAGVEEELRTILTAPEGGRETRVGARILLAEVLTTAGRPNDASEYSGEALRMIEDSGADLIGYRELATAHHILALVYCSQLPEARAVLQSAATRHPGSIVYFAGWTDFVDGIAALRGGQNKEASTRFLLALEALRESDVGQMMTVLLGLAAFSCALAGDAVRARTLVDEFENSPKRGSRSARLHGRVFMAAASSLLDDAPGSRSELLQLAELAEKGGLRQLAALALQLSLLLGDTRGVPSLVRLLEDAPGEDATGLLAFAAATQARDTSAMLDAATTAGAQGNLALEFAGLSLASTYLAEQGATSSARALQRRLTILSADRQGPVPTPLVAAAPAANLPKLTPTERKIVALVKEGYSNRAIAASKSVSVRTVEGPLYRIFAKLGVNRREELRDF
ncbi:hypothetical protein AC792_10355 [Arthrobacter sp. RIT-PI-e]|uniref:helix-turn-helix transcriptional regulator n=1 Tax=Arthrobacter sp. RIT-PI-e TaxID=1681197 RepID=UPI0006760C8F|nr:LuxR family transcriptional regulator [Arthrobacter sp. RIT-PI-e]KNC18759.1 hypothetical protein AC792_10355 [Arthrobacter sp. RIT-PI-e]